jgi:molybdopterin-guanine dinucleotide biosynthesis protein A
MGQSRVNQQFAHWPRLPITAAILNGGKARRFGGRDKQMLEIQGMPIGLALASILNEAAREVLIVGKPHSMYVPLGIRQYEDDVKGKGPVAALFSALRHAAEEWVFLCAVDTPFVSPRLMGRLYSRARERDADIVLCESGGLVQPFSALYRKSLAMELARCVQANPSASFRQFIMTQRHDIVREQEVAALCDPALVFLNINDPASFETALRKAACHGLFHDTQV